MLPICVVCSCSLLWLLEQESLLVKDQVVEDTCEENTLQHDQVANDFTREECVLQLRILNEIVKPLFTKPWHATHLEEIRGLQTWHTTACTSHPSVLLSLSSKSIRRFLKRCRLLWSSCAACRILRSLDMRVDALTAAYRWVRVHWCCWVLHLVVDCVLLVSCATCHVSLLDNLKSELVLKYKTC